MNLKYRMSLRRLRQACAAPLGDLVAAVDEKAIEVELRRFLLCFPSDRLKESQIAEYVQEVMGQVPDAALIEAVEVSRRGPRLNNDEYVALEKGQNYRCAVCGQPLTKLADPHVDHIVAVVFGGSSELSNYQLLCRRCNLGKGSALHWIMTSPMFHVCYQEVSNRMRYAVLCRDGSECVVGDCGETSRTTELTVLPRVPVQRGGRLIFDNLRCVCVEHASQIRAELLRQSLTQLRAVRRGVG
jgi:5-methylcytosine-specific restriction endonuclease McrA